MKVKDQIEMKSFKQLLIEGQLYSYYDDVNKSIVVVRQNGQIFNVKSPELTAPNIKVFGVNVEGEHIIALVGPKENIQPNKKIVFNNAGIYIGSSNIIS